MFYFLVPNSMELVFSLYGRKLFLLSSLTILAIGGADPALSARWLHPRGSAQARPDPLLQLLILSRVTAVCAVLIIYSNLL